MASDKLNNYNSYEHLYSSKNAIRRYPEDDVISFAANLKFSQVLLDLGTGTGRNLLPLLLAAEPNSLVIATDIATSGLQIICEWAKSLGSKEIFNDDLYQVEFDLLHKVGIDFSSFKLYRIIRHQKAHWLGPCALFPPKAEIYNTVILAVGKKDMASQCFKPSSVDAIINRGSIFYLSTKNIKNSIKAMHKTLRNNGRLMLTLKSTEDSRFFTAEPVSGSKWRRCLDESQQKGLEIEFFDKERAIKLVNEFKLLKITHLIKENILSHNKLADWSLVLEK